MAKKNPRKELKHFIDINLEDIYFHSNDNNNKWLKSVGSKIIPVLVGNKDGSEFAFKINGTLAFDCKKNKFSDKSFDISLNISDENIKLFQNEFKEKVISLVFDNKDTNNHLKDDDEMDREFIEENLKNILYKKKDSNYSPSLPLSIKENKFHDIDYNEFIKFKLDDKNNSGSKYINKPDFVKLLKRGTFIEVLLCFRHINSEPSSFKPILQIKCINILNENNIEKLYIDWTKEEFEKHKFTLTPPSLPEGGIPGKKGYINCDDKHFGIRLIGSLAPFNIKNEDLNGKEYYGLSVSLKDEGILASEYLYENISSELAKKSNEFFDKKMSIKSICKKLSTIQSMSKKDLESYKKNLPLEYSPNLGFKIYKKRDSEDYNFVFLDTNGENLDPNSLEEYKKENKSAIYEIKGSHQHIWYGQQYSVKWIVNSVKILEQNSSDNIRYEGFDEDIETETNTEDNNEDNEDNAEDIETETNTEDNNEDNTEDIETETNTEDNNEEPHNSSSDDSTSDEDSD